MKVINKLAIRNLQFPAAGYTAAEVRTLSDAKTAKEPASSTHETTSEDETIIQGPIRPNN